MENHEKEIPMTKPLTYSDAGVDIKKANNLVKEIKNIARQTNIPGVIGDIGGFGGLFALDISQCQYPVLVSSTDGVGTKLKIAFMMDKHDTVGIDLVAMCVNDILVQGAKPLFFLDYFSVGKLEEKIASDVIKGIADGCRSAGCALIGGETAEMPGFYQPGEYDMAGFCVGIVDRNKIIDGSGIKAGHALVGIASSGLHSNGYSLARKICFDILKLDIHAYVPELGRSIGEELITPTKIYSKTIQSILQHFPVQGLAHITGGGLLENIIRVVPEAYKVVIQKKSWPIPPVFDFLKHAGNISDHEMMKTFNNGIGMVVILPCEHSQEITKYLNNLNEKACIIGEITEAKQSKNRIEFV